MQKIKMGRKKTADEKTKEIGKLQPSGDQLKLKPNSTQRALNISATLMALVLDCFGILCGSLCFLAEWKAEESKDVRLKYTSG